MDDCLKNKVTLESMERVLNLWRCRSYGLQWNCLFSTPPWMKAWWETFRSSEFPGLPAVWRNDQLIGIAPLMLKDDQALLVGDGEVCDYLDFAIHPQHAEEFSEALVQYLRVRGITSLVVAPVRSDAMAPAILSEIARRDDLVFSRHDEDVSLELPLPGTWDEFLLELSAKERHETRRKLRRLHEAGRVDVRIAEQTEHVSDEMETFLRLFKLSRPEKASFMSEQMASFFQNLARELAKWNLLKLMFLNIDGHPAASVLCFDYDGALLLYNNGYDPHFNSLSVGLMSKVMSIRYAIEKGRRTYNFLKGAERYKFRLGGNPVHISRCTMRLN